MKYQVDETGSNTCIIQFIPQTEQERQLLATSTEEDLIFYYQDALEKHIDKDANLVGIEPIACNPKRTVVNFQIARGLGN